MSTLALKSQTWMMDNQIPNLFNYIMASAKYCQEGILWFKKKSEYPIDLINNIPTDLLKLTPNPTIKYPSPPISIPPPPKKNLNRDRNDSPRKVLIILYRGGEREVYCPAKKIKEDGDHVHIEFYNKILELKNVLKTEEF